MIRNKFTKLDDWVKNMAKEKMEKVKTEDVSEGTEQQEKPIQNRDFVVTERVLVATINYLASKPYAEVAELIQALRQSVLKD